MSKTLITALLLAALASPATAKNHVERPAPPPDGPPPPNARPGECYARVKLPPRVEQYTEKVMVEPGREIRNVTPPRFEPRTRQVVVREETRRYVATEPVYETVPETVIVRPGYDKTFVEPAQLATVNETVNVEPPRLAWKLVYSPLQPTPVWCLVEEPGRTAVVARTVVVRPETVRTVSVPAEQRTVTRKVLRDPGGVREEVIPPEVKDVVVEELVDPGRVETKIVEPRYADVTKTRVVEPERSEWVPVLCESAATAHRIKSIQGALAKRGYYRGSVDGLYGPATAAAVKRFQADRSLPHMGYLSLPTLQALEVPLEGAKAPSPADARRY